MPPPAGSLYDYDDVDPAATVVSEVALEPGDVEAGLGECAARPDRPLPTA